MSAHERPSPVGRAGQLGALVYGGGGHGRDIAADLGNAVITDDNPERSQIEGDPILAVECVVIGINDSRLRRSLAERKGIKGGQWTHSAAAVGPDVVLGEHVHINAGVTITRTTVGAFTTISPGANICGDVTIGETVTIGAGAVVCQFCTIGDGATIAAGAVLPPHTNVPCNETWGGVPARRLS